ncbi:class 1 fructose-bisphosphatase [candidate division KSB1 bacterium]|nr:class 1 fructose-bisphosphatase [candidate division KSB1 bacterium]
MSQEIITIERFILQQERSFPGATGEFTQLLYDITLAAKIISREVNKAGLVEILGSTGDKNIHGETVQKLDEFANRIIFQSMDHTGRLCIMGSEESETPLLIPDEYPTGKYVLLFDPLDGSSNIDVNGSIGSIFSIHRKKSKTERGDVSDLLQKGYEQVGAAYVIYGSSTMLIYTTGNGVHGFTLDPSVGEFLLSHPHIEIPKNGNIYSVNEGNYIYWDDKTRAYINHLKSEDNHSGKPYSHRYIGSMVADIHRTLLNGGIFMYPVSYKNPDKPSGKLRLLYEAAPMGFIISQAGGYASDGHQNILEIEPRDIHQRTAVFIGDKDDVLLAEKYISAEIEKEGKYADKNQ